MKNILYLLIVFPILLACGEDKEEIKNEKLTKDFLIGTWIVDDGHHYDNVVVFQKNGDILSYNYENYMLYGRNARIKKSSQNSQWDVDEIKQIIIITSQEKKEWLDARYVNSNEFEIKTDDEEIITIYREGHYDRMKYVNDKTEKKEEDKEDYYDKSEDYYEDETSNSYER